MVERVPPPAPVPESILQLPLPEDAAQTFPAGFIAGELLAGNPVGKVFNEVDRSTGRDSHGGMGCDFLQLPVLSVCAVQ